MSPRNRHASNGGEHPSPYVSRPPPSELTVDSFELRGLRTNEKLQIIEDMKRISELYDSDEVLVKAALTILKSLAYWRRAEGEIRDIPVQVIGEIRAEREQIEAVVRDIRGALLGAADYQRQFSVQVDKLLSSLRTSGIAEPSTRSNLLKSHFNHLAAAFLAGLAVGGFGVLVFLGLSMFYLEHLSLI
ncbi:MAG: hypothetical protein AAF703_11990 [Cyanobacteria bacterium P01_D01_bin.105]